MNVRAFVPALLCGLLAACNGPFVLLPGGPLQGETAAVPGDWTFTEEVDTVQLETLPSDPYSVNIWVIALDEHLYVHAGTNRSNWVENIETDPNVRMQIEGSIYELAASRVESQDLFDRFSDAYEEKYGRRPGNEDVSEAYLFELGAR
jgi:hypothetical protein